VDNTVESLGSLKNLLTHKHKDMAAKPHYQEFVEYVVKSIVANPDDVKTEKTVDERGVLITLHINPADMGFVIGKQGQTARAIRTLLKIVGARSDARVTLKIHEPEGSRGRRKADVDTSAVDELTI
jgi:predicted RNA-binding protein YlqC (UPF0109 family)